MRGAGRGRGAEAPDRSDEPAPGPPATASPARAALVAAVVGVWLAVQLGLPLYRLVERGNGERPRTFGWQMFSHQLQEPAERFTIVTAEGSQVVHVDDLPSGPMRREVLYAPRIVEELCTRPDVLAVEVEDVEYGRSTVEC